MVRVLTPDGYIALDVMGNFIFLDHSAAALDNQNSLFVVFIDLVVADHRKSLFLNFDPCLPVESYHMVATNHRAIVLALDKHTIHFITHNANIFLNLGLAYKFFVRPANDAIFLAFLNFVECYRRKSTVDLYPFTVFTDDVSGNLGLAGQTNFDPYSVFVDAIGKDLQFELLAHQMDSYWILFNKVFDDLGTVAPHPPHQQPSLFVVAYDRVFNAEGSQSAYYTNGALDFVAFDLGVGEVEGGLFLCPDGWDCSGAWFDEVAQAEEAIVGGELAPFN